MIRNKNKSLLDNGDTLRNLTQKKFQQDNLHKICFFPLILFLQDMDYNVLHRFLNKYQLGNSNTLKLQNLQRYLLDILRIYYFFCLHNCPFRKDNNDYYPKEK